MRITGVSLAEFERITERVSDAEYCGNVRVHPDARAVSGKSCQGRLYVANSRGPGARTSSSGRHGPYACWHAYRDVLQALFDAYPDARVRTGLANYIGRDGFESEYPAT